MHKTRFAYLLVSLSLVLLLYPYLSESGGGGQLLALLLNLIPLSGAYIVARKRRTFILALLLTVPTAIATWYVIAVKAGGIVGAVAGVGLLAHYLFVIALIAVNLVREKEVTADTIFGAASLYLLLGIVWATIYTLAERLFPGSFASAHPLEWRDFIYYSFVTLTTLGYGDIRPVAHGVKSLAIIEATVGVLFIATLVARLVGIYISNAIKDG